MKPNSSLAKVQTFLHIQNLPNKKLVRQVLFFFFYPPIALSEFFCTFASALVLGGHASPQEIKRESGENPEQFPLL